MAVRYDEVLGSLREAYDARAAWRDGLSKEPWKLAERQAFLERLTPGTRLLEIGAGTSEVRKLIISRELLATSESH